MTSKYFPQQTSDEHYVEIVETATGVVEKRMGPMSEHKANKVERGVLQRIDTRSFLRALRDRRSVDDRGSQARWHHQRRPERQEGQARRQLPRAAHRLPGVWLPRGRVL